ncbi:MAG: hypothetical protein HF981_07310 [Desulfobacteraceae bacterium]|nr:hypothetical protein [Desulfobacteraceae bacterium]MBC2750176.1 hypothetical protein [Desulfobacteraceae bacterium]
MGTIETTYDLTKDLTIIKAVGRMKPADFQEWTATYYAGTVTPLALWDLSEADLSEIQTDDLKKDASHTKSLSDVRKGGKTAIVTGNSLEYGLSRMLSAFYEFEQMPFEVQVFESMDEATKWLGV